MVILAGYADRMETFFSSNPGMSSRVAHHLEFPDYTLDELAGIGSLILRRQRYRLSPAAEQTFREYLARRMNQPRFANARSVRNALERARLRHANRLAAGAARSPRTTSCASSPPTSSPAGYSAPASGRASQSF